MGTIGEFGTDQEIAFVEIDRNDASLAGVGEIGQRGFLTVPREVAIKTV